MKTRINKYLVGALLCPIINSSYAMDAEPIHIEAEIITKLTQNMEKELNDTTENAPLTYTTIKVGQENQLLKPILEQKYKEDKKNNTHEALKMILDYTQQEWKEVRGNAGLKLLIKNMLNGQTIGEEAVNISKTFKVEDFNKLQGQLQKDKDLEELLFKQLVTTVEAVEAANGKIQNEDKILHDKQSKVIALYKNDSNLKNSINKIKEEKISKDRIKAILEEATDKDKNKYKFCNKGIDKNIIEYISTKLEKEIPYTKRVPEIINNLYDKSLQNENEETKTIINFLIAYQQLEPRAYNEYKGKEVKLTNSDLDAQLTEINTKININLDEYRPKYEATKDTKDLKKKLEKYIDKNEMSTIINKKFKSDQVKPQLAQFITDIKRNDLLAGIQKMIKATEDLTKENTTKATDLKNKEKALKTATDKNTKYEQEINQAKTDLQAAQDEITTHKTTITTLNEQITKLQKLNQAYENQMETLAELAGVDNDPDNVTQTFNTINIEINEKLNQLEEGAPVGNTADELKKKDEAITELKNKINTLNNKITQLSKAPGKGGNEVLQKANEELKEQLLTKDARILELEQELAAEKKKEPSDESQINRATIKEIFDEMIKKSNGNTYTVEYILETMNKKLKTKNINPIAGPEKK